MVRKPLPQREPPAGGAPRSISRKPEKREAIRAAKQKAGWLRFGFPLHYNSDVLEAMLALARAGAPRRSPRVRRALDAILARRRPDDRWDLDFSHNGKRIADVERKGQPGRWITCRGLGVRDCFLGLRLPGPAGSG